MENKVKVNVVIEVKANDYKNGEVVNAVEADAKLKTVFGGREQARDEHSITMRGTTCGIPTIEADYNSALIGAGDVETKVEFHLKGKGVVPGTHELVDAFSAEGKIDKDTEVEADKVVQDWFKLKAVKDCGDECAIVENYFNTKSNDI